MQLTLYVSNSSGNAKNTSYPNKRMVTNAEELKQAVMYDHVCAEFQNNYRSKDQFIWSDCDVFDCDNGHSDNPDDWIYPEDYEWLLDGICYAVVPSRNNMKAKNGKSARPRHHFYFPHNRFTSAEECEQFKRRVQEQYPFFDANALDAARFIFGHNADEILWVEGDGYLDEILSSEMDLFEMLEIQSDSIKEGSRNATMSHTAGKLVKRYGNTDAAYQAFLSEAEKCVPPLGQDELQTIWHSAIKFGRKVQNQSGYIAPEDYNQELQLMPSDYSDVGQATVLAREYNHKLRYSPSTEYLVYNGSFWEESKPLAQAVAQELTERQLDEAMIEIEKCIKELTQTGALKLIIGVGAKKAKEQFTKPQKRAYEKYENALNYEKYAVKRRDSKYIWSALKEVHPMVQISPVDLDMNEFLLNTPVGTIDLQSGEMQEHQSIDFITKQTSTSPTTENKSIWLDTLNTIFVSDQALIDYVQQIVGLAAIGKVYVEALIISYGEGRNGKSTFWNVISRVLGTYSGSISADILTSQVRRNVKPELAEAKGKRLLIAAELEEGMRLDTSNIKQLCSTDEIAAEKKYKDPFKYVPTHTLVLYTNHLPKVGAIDKGTWRRLIVIPFLATIEGGQDIKNYADYLYEQCGGAVLQWIIDGAKKVIQANYQLTIPPVVQEAIQAYKQNNDWLGYFIEECCEVGTSYTEKSGQLYSEYRAFCMRTGEFARSTADFYTALESLGITKKRTASGVIIYGLKLASEFLDYLTGPYVGLCMVYTVLFLIG